jgi:hypothetical protein
MKPAHSPAKAPAPTLNTASLAAKTRLNLEFNRQVETLLAKGYPKLAGLSARAFLALCERLRTHLRLAARLSPDPATGRIPFVLVVQSHCVRPAVAMTRVRREGRAGLVSMQPVAPDDFQPITSLRVPRSVVYLLIDFDRGDRFRNVRPEDALRQITANRRSPLTIEEGVAVLTHYPDWLIKNHCFSLPGSRRADQRVPALWLSQNRPKLGWCWDRNPHTWLGAASCARRTDVRRP